MANLWNFVGVLGGIVAIVTAIGSVWYQRRQTLILARQVDREIARELDAPESGMREGELRGVLNRRLGDVRRTLRDDFNPKIENIELKIENIERTLEEGYIRESMKLAANAVNVLSTYKESAEKIVVHDRELQALQHAVEDVRSSMANPDTARAQIRGIAEQLLKIVDADAETSKRSDGFFPDSSAGPQWGHGGYEQPS